MIATQQPFATLAVSRVSTPRSSIRVARFAAPQPKGRSLRSVIVRAEAENAPKPKPKPKGGMSSEQKAKLRAEYIGFGGSESTPPSSNFFLNIMIGISVLAVVAKLAGAY